VIIILKKKIFFPILALAIITTALASSTIVSAQDSNGHNSIVEAIAAKFNLNQSDVQAVFEEERTKHEQQMQANLEQKLTQAVTDGKITEAQKQAIIAKMSEQKNNRPNPEEFKNLTAEQRKAKMDEKKTEMENWAKENGLTLETLHSIIGGPKGMGHGMMFKMH
jgi:hypothetical protein